MPPVGVRIEKGSDIKLPAQIEGDKAKKIRQSTTGGVLRSSEMAAQTGAAPTTADLNDSTAEEILDADENRQIAIITNPSDSGLTGYLGYTNAVTANNAAIILEPGDSWVETIYAGKIFGIASGALTVRVQEATD